MHEIARHAINIRHANDEHANTLLMKQSLRFRMQDFINVHYLFIVYKLFIINLNWFNYRFDLSYFIFKYSFNARNFMFILGILMFKILINHSVFFLSHFLSYLY